MKRGLAAPVLLTVLWANAVQAQGAPPPQLRFSGDFRVRYEQTSAGNGVPSLGREVVRFRLGVTYPLRSDLSVRARLATGDPNDPNSTDVTLGTFVNDLAVSLDLASVELNRPRFGVVAGKFINPFLSTELVWDGDVNPEGASGRLKLGRAGGVTATLTALYLIVDQQVGDSGSEMGGGQLAVNATAGGSWRVTAAAGYYDYRLRSLVNTQPGDIRGNRLLGARYLSDFNLLDALVAVDYTGFGEHYPLRVVGDYVHNSGAADLNTGWEADVYVGRNQQPRDLRYRYGYGVVETDAVLAAFSHDNTSLGTNYEIHTLSVDAIPIAGLFMNATLYHYRPHQVAGAREFQDRLRLNAMVTF